MSFLNHRAKFGVQTIEIDPGPPWERAVNAAGGPNYLTYMTSMTQRGDI